MAVKSFALQLVKKFSDIVLDAIAKGSRLKGLKAKLLEATLDIREINVNVLCEALRDIGRVYYEPLVEGLSSLGFCVVNVEAALKDRLVIGASGGLFASIFEVGLMWNHIFDLPFIPGSSVKGVMRSLMLHHCAKLGDAMERRECISVVLEFLGASTRPLGPDELDWIRNSTQGFEPVVEAGWAGKVFVADAFPVARGHGKTGCGILDFDVLTPHYYEGGKVKRDEFEAMPTPVPHLVVAPGTVFRFVIGVDRVGGDLLSRLEKYFGVGDACKLASRVLLEALGEGLGARTTKGYGVFNVSRVRVVNRSPPMLVRRRSGRVSWRRRES